MLRFILTVILAPLLSRFAPTSNSSDPIADPIVTSIIRVSPIEQEVGEKITVTLDRRLDATSLPVAHFSTIKNKGEITTDAVALDTDRSQLTVRIPSDILRGELIAQDVVVTFTSSPDPSSPSLAGRAIVLAHPRASPAVTSFNDQAADAMTYIRPGQPFTVRGEGFFAPKEQIKFIIGSASADGTPGSHSFTAETISVAPNGKSFTAEFPSSAVNVPRGVQPYVVTVWNRCASRQTGSITVEIQGKLRKGWALFFSLLPVIIVVFAIGCAVVGIRYARTYLSAPQGGESAENRGALETLLVDPSTNTYSLSRFQFLAWLLALAWAYSFVFVARVQVAADWSFPDLAGSEFAFLISLGTLVGSMATSAILGPKGAGDLRPSARDLIVHGGVVALDRLQQLLWTFVAICILIVITFSTAATAGALPTIPQELLTLMGVSSVGYLAGKASRRPGPVVNQAYPQAGELHVVGMYLSTDAQVFVNGTSQRKESVRVGVASHDRPNEFADSLIVAGVGDTALRSVTVLNPDGQEAKWSPPPPSTPPAEAGRSPAPPVVDADAK